MVEIASNPAPSVTWYGPDGAPIPEGEARQRTVHTALSIKNTRSMLKLNRLRLEDSGDYSIKVENEFHVKWENFSLEVTDRPKMELTVLLFLYLQMNPMSTQIMALKSHTCIWMMIRTKALN